MKEEASSLPDTPEALLRQIHLSLRELVESAQTSQDRAAKLQKLHPTDMACIAYLGRQYAPVSAKQITNHLSLSSGSGTALLDRLEAAGYVRRLPNPEDRRGVLIDLDRIKAKVPLEKLGEIEQRYLKLAASFSKRDFEAILRFLDETNRIARDLSAD